MFWVFGFGIAGCQSLTIIFRRLQSMTAHVNLRWHAQTRRQRPNKSLQPTVIPLRGLPAAELKRRAMEEKQALESQEPRFGLGFRITVGLLASLSGVILWIWAS